MLSHPSLCTYGWQNLAATVFTACRGIELAVTPNPALSHSSGLSGVGMGLSRPGHQGHNRA